jgi:hypothetical protein
MSKGTNTPDTDLLAQVDALPNELAPTRDLWPGIEQAINAKSQIKPAANDSHWHNWSRTAAAFVPAAFVLMFWLQDSPSPTDFPESVTAIGAGFELQKRQLLRHVNAEDSVVYNWQGSLSELESAEQAILNALQSQPEDPALLKMLAQIYQQQLGLIQKVSDSQSQTQFSQI